MLETKKKPKICLIAGFGSIPLELVKSALKQGEDMTVFSLDKKNSVEFRKLGVPTYDFSVIEIFPMLNKGKELEITEACFIGKVPKSSFFKSLHKIDKEVLDEIWKLKDLNDDSLHLKIVDFVENTHGFKIIDQSKYIKHLFPSEQVFTNAKPSTLDLEEIKYGLKMAKANASLDIGQTVITRNKSVIAVEAIEGTNNAIKRAKELIGFFDSNKKIYVNKVAKPNQDKRFDIPTVGLETIKAMPKNSFLSFEADETFFLDQDKAVKLANDKGICIASFKI